MSLASWLRKLFGRPKTLTRDVQSREPQATSTPTGSPPPRHLELLDVPPRARDGAVEPADIAVIADEGETVDEDDWSTGMDEDADEALDAPDPFSTGMTTPPPLTSPDEIATLRAKAEIQALCGEHRIYINTPAGPGSLAEALGRLVQEGRVTANFVENEGDPPYLHYVPCASRTP